MATLFFCLWKFFMTFFCKMSLTNLWGSLWMHVHVCLLFFLQSLMYSALLGFDHQAFSLVLAISVYRILIPSLSTMLDFLQFHCHHSLERTMHLLACEHWFSVFVTCEVLTLCRLFPAPELHLTDSPFPSINIDWCKILVLCFSRLYVSSREWWR